MVKPCCILLMLLNISCQIPWQLYSSASALPSAPAGPVPDGEENTNPPNSPDRLCATLQRSAE